MQFRTQIFSTESPIKLNHQDFIFSVGSCFAENIGGQMNELKFQNHVNPFGILYNPVSILYCLERLQKEEAFSVNELIENNELWHSFEHHGKFSGLDKKQVLENINSKFQESSNFLKKANRLILTFGTANIFVFKETGKVVANCHKIPNKEFERKRLSIQEIIEKYFSFLQNLKSQNTDLEVIITVSPVRHIRDGIIENQRSKATLLLAIENICEVLNFVHYFPSYEILMDDLRDYRFYNADLIHPNEVALEYIWQLFSDTFFEEETKNLIGKIEQINAGLKHRPIYPDSEAHRKFLKNLLGKIEELEKESGVSFESEKQKIHC